MTNVEEEGKISSTGPEEPAVSGRGNEPDQKPHNVKTDQGESITK